MHRLLLAILLCALLVIPASAQEPDLASGLIGYWPMDEASGPRANRAPGSSIGAFGELDGAVATTPGHIFERAASFSGADNPAYLYMGRESFGELETAVGADVGRTWAIWLRVYAYPTVTSPLHYHSIWVRGMGTGNAGGSSGGECININAGGAVWANVGNYPEGGAFAHGPARQLPLGEWVLYVVRLAPEESRFDVKRVTADGWIDGDNAEQHVGPSASIPYAVTELTIGKPWRRYLGDDPDPDGYLRADVGPVALWSRALTEADALAYYNGGAGVKLIDGDASEVAPPLPALPLSGDWTLYTPDGWRVFTFMDGRLMHVGDPLE